MAKVVGKEIQLPSIREAAKQERKLRRKIERALAAGQVKRAKYFTQEYLDSGSAKFIATIMANVRYHLEKRMIPPTAAAHNNLFAGYVSFAISKRKKLAGSDFVA